MDRLSRLMPLRMNGSKCTMGVLRFDPECQWNDANWITALNAIGSGAWPDKISEIVVGHIKFVLID
jgi:hypothetical protein